MNQEFELIAKTFQGLEEVLAGELTRLGADNIEIGRRMVSFTGNKEMMYRANFCLRTAIRILKPIKHFAARTADEVYDAVKDVTWENYLECTDSFAVDAQSVKGTKLQITHINLLDNTVEGLKCDEDKVFTVQYHPESAPGPEDSGYLFDQFTALMRK